MTKYLDPLDPGPVPLEELLVCEEQWPADDRFAPKSFLITGISAARKARGDWAELGLTPGHCETCRALCHQAALTAGEAWTVIRMLAGSLSPDVSNEYTERIALPSTHDEFWEHMGLMSLHMSAQTDLVIQLHRLGHAEGR